MYVDKFFTTLSSLRSLATMIIFFNRTVNVIKLHFSLSCRQRLSIINVANERRDNITARSPGI